MYTLQESLSVLIAQNSPSLSLCWSETRSETQEQPPKLDNITNSYFRAFGNR